MPHLVCTPYTTEEEQPDWFEVIIDDETMVESSAQTLGDSSVRLYYSLFQYPVNIQHSYSVIAVQDDPVLGEQKSSAAIGNFTIILQVLVPSPGGVHLEVI